MATCLGKARCNIVRFPSGSRSVGRILFATLCLFLAAVSGRDEPVAKAVAWQAKVDPWLLADAAAGETEFLLFLAEQADLSHAATLGPKETRGAYVYRELTAVARVSQAPLLEELARRGLAHRPYWIANMVWVRADLNALEVLAGRADVARVHANPQVQLSEPVEVDGYSRPLNTGAIEWNIGQIGAPAVWQSGINGQGVIVGGQDTGYQWDHPALIDQYHGWNGAMVDHNYNWHDAIHSSSGICGAPSAAPCDDHNHGTHTMGTMVGSDGAANQIGVAPGAQWIGCRNMDNGWGTPTTYSECFQWFVAPTDLNGLNPDPARAPHVINNSWGCSSVEGCTDPAILQTVVENTRAAGIVVVASAGNGGSACATVLNPPAIYQASLSIGATGSDDNIAVFSSRGPVTADGSNRLKPELSAPGVAIRSAIRNNGYDLSSGTSMAGPHVAGLVALLIAAQPGLAGEVWEIEQILKSTAVPRTTSQDCGLIPGTNVPNNSYGYGRIDALAAYHAALAFTPKNYRAFLPAVHSR